MAIATTTEWNLRQRQRRTLRDLRELLQTNVMRGSLVSVSRRCGKPNCVCAKDASKRHGRRVVSANVGGRTRAAHVDDAHLEGVRRATANYRRLWKLLDELTELNLKLLAFPAPVLPDGE